MFAFVLSTLVACGGEAPAPATPAPTEPAAAPAEPAAPAPAPGGASLGPYTPDEPSQKAYDAAKAAGADATAVNPKAGNAEAIAKGKAHFAGKCASCHGAEGKGDGAVASALPQKPSNFHWKERWDFTPIGTKHWILKNGIAGAAMAPLGLSDDEAWEVLAYIESEFVGK
jgi:mono/diheme cytochrome c family protein